MDFHRYDHRKADGRQLYLYSRDTRDYRVTNDVEGPYAPNPHLRSCFLFDSIKYLL